MKVFLTGGTGFVGSHVLQHLLAAGHDVIAIRRPGRSPRIPLVTEPTWLEGDLCDDWSGVLEQCESLVHLAATGVSPQESDWEQLFQVNLTESLALCRDAAKVGVQRMVLCGSCFEYGRSGERYDFIPVDAPLEPTSAYGASKAAASVAAIALAAEQSLEMQILRPFHVFGEGQHASNFWPSLRFAAIAGNNFEMTLGEQVRDFVSVEEVTQGFLSALDQQIGPGSTVIKNVGTGKPQTLRKFAESWWSRWEATGNLEIGALPYRENEVMRYVPEIG